MSHPLSPEGEKWKDNLSRKEAGEIYNEIRELHETDYYWYVQSLAEIFERHGYRHTVLDDKATRRIEAKR